MEVVGIRYGYKGLLEEDFIELNMRNVCDIIHRGGTKIYTARCPEFKYEESVRKAIEEDRQSVSKAREAWEKASGKKASDITFKRFLEALVQDISE